MAKIVQRVAVEPSSSFSYNFLHYYGTFATTDELGGVPHLHTQGRLRGEGTEALVGAGGRL